VDPAAFPQLMVAVAEGRAIGDVLRSIVDGIAACGHVALARLWLIRPGDICAECRFASECPDRTRCLHLAASAGNPSEPGVDLRRIDGGFRRFPLGVRKIGRIGATGEVFVISEIRGDESWIADGEWVRREGIKTFVGIPLVFRREILGVLGVFDRQNIDDGSLKWLRTFADHGAVSIANARAFEEIEALRRRLELENDYLREEVAATAGLVEGFIGPSAALAKVRQQIALVGPTMASVLVAGESGTGKELVAWAIHEASPRRGRALIKANCAAIPENLFESEFFGHVKGAFTGALRDRPGRFELAEGGTLFLDEIGELALPLQAKLLRVIQDGNYERVGDARTRRADVRLVAATNRDLVREVEAGRFRQDLYFRLSVFPIEVPPLRARPEDIGPLALHFARAAARRHGSSCSRLGRAALADLEGYSWPGNVRELQNVVERATILAGRGPLRFELPQASPADAKVSRPPAQPPVDAIETRGALKQRERDTIVAALARSGGRIFGPKGAAVLLGMPPTTLASRVKSLGIARPGR
jgi:transcriptional regulator with GAF, ATPase, and Fis domain